MILGTLFHAVFVKLPLCRESNMYIRNDLNSSVHVYTASKMPLAMSDMDYCLWFCPSARAAFLTHLLAHLPPATRGVYPGG